MFHFASVKVLIPETWEAAHCGLNTINLPNAVEERYQSADMRLQPQHPAYREAQLWTEQPGGCGVPGNYIAIPPSFLQDPVKNKGNVIMFILFIRYAW